MAVLGKPGWLFSIVPRTRVNATEASLILFPWYNYHSWVAFSSCHDRTNIELSDLFRNRVLIAPGMRPVESLAAQRRQRPRFEGEIRSVFNKINYVAWPSPWDQSIRSQPIRWLSTASRKPADIGNYREVFLRPVGLTRLGARSYRTMDS
jgi:hypothetical protein